MSDTTLPPESFTTGLAPLPDLGALEYNGVTFSSLFSSRVNWTCEQDNAGRTVKWVKLTIEAEGVVTLGENASTIDNQMQEIRRRLATDAGQLRYQGRGFGTNVPINASVGSRTANQQAAAQDLNWGPKTETLAFQPLGGGLSAMVHWRVTTWISEQPGGGANVLQFNNETSISFDDDFYTKVSIKGTLEIGMTRPTPQTRSLQQTVDQYRERWFSTIANIVDLRRFRVTERTFNVSRDRRVLEWSFVAEELPPVVMPFGSPTAHGSFRWAPMKKGQGLVNWLVTLRVTYTIDKRYPRRTAWFHFITLTWYRMLHAQLFAAPSIAENAVARTNALENARLAQQLLGLYATVPQMTPAGAVAGMTNYLTHLQHDNRAGFNPATFRSCAQLISISGDEGLYLDGRQVTFEAQWRLQTTLETILLSTGMWRYQGMQVNAAQGQPSYNTLNNAWATTLGDVAGWRSWMAALVDPRSDVIVDFGTDAPPPTVP